MKEAREGYGNRGFVFLDEGFDVIIVIIVHRLGHVHETPRESEGEQGKRGSTEDGE